jgi:endonuclease/exonuclease/phosphatase family metal-dependent hydrolase
MTRLRVATFNALHGLSLATGSARPTDLAAAAKELTADVVGLQEVDRGQDRSGGVDQTALVAEALAADHYRFVPALAGTPGRARTWTAVLGDGDSGAGGPTYGVGLVSRHPVRAWFVRRFPASSWAMPLLVPRPRPHLEVVPDEPRVALAARIDAPGGPLTVVTGHLSFVPGVNVAQLRAVARWARTLPGPRLFAGDVNLPGPLPRWITGWERLARVATYPSYAPRVQFDHVLGDGVDAATVIGVEALRLLVSDHCALAVDLDR